MSKEATDVKPSDPDVRIVEPEQSLFKDSEPSKTAKPAKAPRPLKPPKQPEFRSDAYFDILKVQIDDSKQHTKLQGAQTAEQVSKEVKQTSLDEAQLTLRHIRDFWDKKEAKYVPDEDELLAIKKSEESSREAPPQFNI